MWTLPLDIRVYTYFDIRHVHFPHTRWYEVRTSRSLQPGASSASWLHSWRTSSYRVCVVHYREGISYPAKKKNIILLCRMHFHLFTFLLCWIQVVWAHQLFLAQSDGIRIDLACILNWFNGGEISIYVGNRHPISLMNKISLFSRGWGGVVSLF